MLIRVVPDASNDELEIFSTEVAATIGEVRHIGNSLVPASSVNALPDWISDHPLVESTETMTGTHRLVARSVVPEGTRVRVGRTVVGGGDFVVVAGPCAVESEEQIETAAECVVRAGASILRGGAYKPRTSPYSFQGLGARGVELLAAAGRRAGVPTITEVVSASDIPFVAEHVDALQVGARNSQNFDLLKALGSARRPVLLKRGLSMTIDELLHAAEYIVAHGNPNVILCERGIRSFETSTRNTLDLNAVPVLKQLTHLPVIVDPSHGTGRRDLIAPLARAAAAVGADGLIVEVHPDPDTALSDGAQSLPPSGFESLMGDLAALLAVGGRRLATISLEGVEDRMLEVYRAAIDRIDERIAELIRARLDVALRIGEIKESSDQDVRAPDRESEVLAHVSSLALEPLTMTTIERLYRVIIDETCEAQQRNLYRHGNTDSQGVGRQLDSWTKGPASQKRAS